MEKQDYIEILEFLRDHSKEIYIKPEKAKNDSDKKIYEELALSGDKSLKKFKEISDRYVAKLTSSTNPRWFDPSKESRVKSYFWTQLKYKEKEKLSTSIAIFAEKEKKLRYRITLEIRDDKSIEKDYIRHFRYLNILNVDNTNFEYFGERNENLELNSLTKEEIKKWIEDVKSRKEKKIQVGRTLEYEDILSMDVEDIERFFDNTVNELIRYYEAAVSSNSGNVSSMSIGKCGTSKESKNQILYGPPGTGKTYNVISRALEIIDKEKYKSLIENEENRDGVVLEFNKLLEEGQIAFCTFHQSYGYEEFVEGLRSDEEGKGFVVQPGIFKLICEKASAKAQEWLPKYDFDENKINFYKMALGNKLDNDESIYNYCIDNNCVALGWGENIDFSKCKADCDVKEMYSGVSGGALSAVKCFVTSVKKDDIVIIGYGMKKARAIGRVIGDYEFNEDTPIGYNHFRKVEWLYKDGNLDKTDILKSKSLSQGSIYKFKTEDLNLSRIRELISHKSEQSENVKNYVLIIDEINRGNISKIFGELITLIEEDKRLGEKNELKVTLPYSNDKFGVPSNVYILGTMNTADRSIALLDTALRRRFTFKEYMPDVSKISVDVDGINVGRFLDVINKRVEYLFDRDHTIGHAYFMKDNLTFEDLVLIMKNKIIPLLKEYFYGDWEKVELILGGAGINNDYFINKKKVNVSGLFKTNIIDNYQEQYIYSIVDNPTKEAFLNVYEGITE